MSQFASNCTPAGKGSIVVCFTEHHALRPH